MRNNCIIHREWPFAKSKITQSWSLIAVHFSIMHKRFLCLWFLWKCFCLSIKINKGPFNKYYLNYKETFSGKCKWITIPFHSKHSNNYPLFVFIFGISRYFLPSIPWEIVHIQNSSGMVFTWLEKVFPWV